LEPKLLPLPPPRNAESGQYGLSDPEEVLLAFLRHEWSIDENESIKVLAFIPPSNTNFAFASPIYSISARNRLHYPYTEEDSGKNYVYVSGNICSRKDVWAILTCELSPLFQREKHSVPFGLCATKAEVLKEPPLWLSKILASNEAYKNIDPQWDRLSVFRIPKEDTPLIESTFYEVLKNKFQKEREKAFEEIEREKSEKQKEISTLNETITSLSQEISDINTDITNNKEKASKIKKKIKELIKAQKEEDEKLEKLKNYIKEQNKILLSLDLLEEEDLEVSSPTSLEGYSLQNDFNGDQNKLIGYIQNYAYHKGYFYTRNFLKDFLSLIRTNDLIVLAGDSGSGKTSICKIFAQAVGGESIVIPVKPNWTSNEDLMGYYNPIEHKYLATPFLNALRSAEKDPGRLYLLCLDEMNIARVEYYFADFLSLLEERSKQPVFDLFATTEIKALRSEVTNFVTLAKVANEAGKKKEYPSFLDIIADPVALEQFKNMCGIGEAQSLLKYHSDLKGRLENALGTQKSIELPRNVRIVGTVNIDDTTHYLSPKILDRVNVIKFSSKGINFQDEIKNELEDFPELNFDFPVCLTPAELGERHPYPGIETPSLIVEDLKRWAENYLYPLGVEFSFRSIRQAIGYEKEMNAFGSNQKEILNYIILHKILPKIVLNGDLVRDGKSNKEKLQNFKQDIVNTIGAEKSCVQELTSILEKSESYDGQLNYWLR